MRTLPFALLISLFMTACFSTTKAPVLSGSNWEVVVIVDTDSTISITSDARPSIAFTSDGDFNAHTPCNSIGGVYNVGDNGKIEMTTQSSTMALCPDITYESSFVRALEAVKFFTIESDTLKLKDIDGRLIIKLADK